jgi:hypothetical protein
MAGVKRCANGNKLCMARRQNAWRLALALGSVAVVLSRLVTTRRQRHWLQHRRGEGRAAATGHEIRPEPGDILLFHHVARLRDVLIVLVTRSPFYHAALYAGDMQVIEARPQGVRQNDLKGREHNFVVLPAPAGKGEAALAWARGQIGDPFDRMDFLVIFLEHLLIHWHINYSTPGKYTCAEFVTTAFRQVGVDLVPGKDADEVAPADLAHLLPQATIPVST